MDYSELLKKHGPNDPRSVKWGDKRTQYFRFKILCEIADLTNEAVLDYGCGLGDLYDYLQTQGFKGTYAGQDINSDLIRAAREKYPLNFWVGGGEIPGCDYALLSGVFNESFEGREQMIKDTLTKVYEAARKGVAYNGIYGGAEMATSDPAELFRFCTTLTPYVTLRQDYRGGNFTLYLYRDKGINW